MNSAHEPTSFHSMRYKVKSSILFHKFQVIKKIMKMEAAEPFNAPVDPVALGIPVSPRAHLVKYRFQLL